MEIAFVPAVVETLKVTPAAPVIRDPLSSRSRPKNWAVASTIGRGQLIDLVV